MKGGMRPPGFIRKNFKKSKTNFRLVRGAGGFTIIEVMIVLAISGLLLASVALMLNGRQNQVGFNDAVNDAAAQVQQSINNVTNGYYPNYNNFKCVQGNASSSQPGVSPGSSSSGSNAAGYNNGCIFLGNVMEFGVNPQLTEIDTNTVIGNSSSDITGDLSLGQALPAQTLSAAHPGILEYLLSQNPNAAYKPGGTYMLTYGLQVKGMCYSTDANSCNAGQTGEETNPISSIVFASNPSVSSSGGSLSSGSQDIMLAAIPGNDLGSTSIAQASAANCSLGQNAGCLAYQLLPSPGHVEVCLYNQTDSALITIGGNSGVPAVSSSIKLGKSDCS